MVGLKGLFLFVASLVLLIMAVLIVGKIIAKRRPQQRGFEVLPPRDDERRK